MEPLQPVASAAAAAAAAPEPECPTRAPVDHGAAEGLSLCSALDCGRGDVVAFVGGGGKTTLMLTLARELAEQQKCRVLVTTTTRMMRSVHAIRSQLTAIGFTRGSRGWIRSRNAYPGRRLR